MSTVMHFRKNDYVTLCGLSPFTKRGSTINLMTTTDKARVSCSRCIAKMAKMK